MRAERGEWQPWSFTVVSDHAQLDQISQNAKIYMTNNRPLALPDELYEKLADPEFHIFYHAPVLIVIAATGPASWISEDCALAAENMMLAAHASGLGTCWIGLCQPFLTTPSGKRAIRLSDLELPLAPIILGYPRAAAHVPARKPADIRWIE